MEEGSDIRTDEYCAEDEAKSRQRQSIVCDVITRRLVHAKLHQWQSFDESARRPISAFRHLFSSWNGCPFFVQLRDDNFLQVHLRWIISSSSYKVAKP
jgi:hypothetical protein